MWKQRESTEQSTTDDLWDQAVRLRVDLSNSLTKVVGEIESRARELESTESGLGRILDDLQRANQELADIFEASPNAYVITDESRTILQVNRSASRLLNAVPATLVGQTWSESRFGVSLDARATRLPSRQGSPPRLLWHLTSGDGRGSVDDQSAIPTPIEEGDRVDGEIPEAILRRAFSESVVGVVVVVGARGEQAFLNPAAARILGRPDSGKSGIHRFDGSLYFPNGRPHALSVLCLERILRGKTVVGESAYIRARNGSQRWIRLCGGPITDGTGTVVGGLLVMDDVTAIHEEQRRRAEWLSVVVHDLRAPLAIISGYAQLLRKEAADRDGHEGDLRALETIGSHAARLNRMISDLMEASRIEIRKLALQRQQTNLLAMVERLAEDARQTAPDRPVEVVAPNPEACVALVDPERLDQVLDNLLQNAIKYGTPGTPIQMAVTCDPRTVQIRITNHGQGFSPQEATRLFRRFHRTSAATKSRSEGLGLGLYIARGIVEAHGGQISVESVPNQTTTFTISLPTERVSTLPGIQNAW